MCYKTIRKKQFDVDIIDVVQKYRQHLSAEHHHFSVFVLGTKVLTVANNYASSCVHSPSIHSEIHGIMKLARLNSHKKIIRHNDLIDIYNVRMNKHGTIGNSRPCKNCLEQMQKCTQFRFGKVHYTTPDGVFTSEKFTSMYDNPKTIPSSGNRRRELMRNLIKNGTDISNVDLSDIMRHYGFSSDQKAWILSTIEKNGGKIRIDFFHVR